MADVDNINLFTKDQTAPEYIQKMDLQLRRLSILALIALVIFGSTTIAAYLILKVRYESLQNQKSRLLTQLKNLSAKENKFLVIKSRIGFVQSIINSSKPIGNYLNKAYLISPPPIFTSFNYGLDGKTEVSYKAGSISDLASIAAKYADMTINKEIFKSMITGFSIGEAGFATAFTYFSY